MYIYHKKLYIIKSCPNSSLPENMEYGNQCYCGGGVGNFRRFPISPVVIPLDGVKFSYHCKCKPEKNLFVLIACFFSLVFFGGKF